MDKRLFYEILSRVQKPARYTGGEINAVIKDKNKVDLRFAFCFPDIYEVGSSHLGMKILYSAMNERENMWCERVFSPWFDMRDEMIKHGLPLFALESRDELTDFDIIGFTLQYEMSYTTVLDMLRLSNIPLRSADRGDGWPLVIAGGPCVCNPEPLADFFDLFVLGEGELLNIELGELYIEAKRNKLSREEFLKLAEDIDGVYVPSHYKVDYNADGTVKAYEHMFLPGKRPEKRIEMDLSAAYFPDKFVVPLIEIIHDRATCEVLRGCIRGCRFCQAGFIYRPFRARSADVISKQAKALCDNCGYDEVSLSSLSTSDHPQLEELLDDLLEWSEKDGVNLSLPSLRIDSFSDELLKKTTKVRKSGLTFAPEAGTQRLRDVINKNITEDEIMKSCNTAFRAGYMGVKLYFMIGLPTETDDDIRAIMELSQRIVDLYYANPDRIRGKQPRVSVSTACFVPKPHTPFEFYPQNTIEEFARKQGILIEEAKKHRKVSLSWHDASTSFIEAVLAKGDRRLSSVLETVLNNGGILEAWDEGFELSRWHNAFAECKVDPAYYANREAAFDETMPWDVLDYGISKDYLVSEYRKALESKTTSFCMKGCDRCGISRLAKGACFD